MNALASNEEIRGRLRRRAAGEPLWTQPPGVSEPLHLADTAVLSAAADVLSNFGQSACRLSRMRVSGGIRLLFAISSGQIEHYSINRHGRARQLGRSAPRPLEDGDGIPLTREQITETTRLLHAQQQSVEFTLTAKGKDVIVTLPGAMSFLITPDGALLTLP